MNNYGELEALIKDNLKQILELISKVWLKEHQGLLPEGTYADCSRRYSDVLDDYRRKLEDLIRRYKSD